MLIKKGLPLQSFSLLLALTSPGLIAQQIAPAPNTIAPADATASATLPKHPAEMTPNAPRVTCQGNQLTIQADNSSLISVLAAVHACIGVAIDLPDGFPDTRAYLHLGPGTAREVLDALLSSTDLNYVIQSSSAAPSRIETVLLMARLNDMKESKGSAAPTGFAMTPARRAWADSRRNLRPAQAAPEESPVVEPEVTESAVDIKDKPAITPPESSTATPAPITPSSADATQPAPASEKPVAENAGTTDSSVTATSAPAVAASDSGEDTPAKKVLQGKISEMQQLFEQRKQMIANPAAAADPH
jgi:hypothetical protein